MIATVIERAGDQLGDFLPRIAGALILLIAGLLAAIVLGRLAQRALGRAGLDRLADRSGTSELLGQAGLPGSLSGLVGTAVRCVYIRRTPISADRQPDRKCACRFARCGEVCATSSAIPRWHGSGWKVPRFPSAFQGRCIHRCTPSAEHCDEGFPAMSPIR